VTVPALLVVPARVATAQAPTPAPTPAPAQAPTAAPRPITLLEALTLAAQNNQGLRVAAFETVVARAQLAQAEAVKSGQLTLAASYTRINERTTTVTIGTTPIQIPFSPNLYSAALTYTYPIYTGGRIDSQIALAQANLRGAEATLERTKQQLVLDVKQAYFGLLTGQAGIDVALRTVAAADENLRVARARVAAGASPRFDEIQAEVNLANAQQGLIRTRNTLSLATQGLNALMAIPLDTMLAPRETMTIIPVRTDVNALIRRALEARPELAELRARLAAAQAAIEVARSGGRPTVVLAAGPNYGNSSGALSSPVATTGWSVTLSATVPLFDGHLTEQRVKEAEVRVEQLKASEAQLLQGIELDVRRAMINYASAAEELVTADKTIGQAQEGFRIATVRFSAGVSTNLEVIQAQQGLTQAEANRVAALFDVNVARAQLERAVGGAVE
jgi:outer membrane protein TolC